MLILINWYSDILISLRITSIRVHKTSHKAVTLVSYLI